MASPTQNSVPATTINTSSLSNDVQALLAGTKWGGGLGTGVALTYSFPGANGSTTWWASPYSSTNEPNTGDMVYLNSAEQSACQAALSVWSASANITFNQLADTQTTCGEIRLAISDLGNTGSDYAHAYYPGSTPVAGDVWFGYQWNTDAAGGAAPGSYQFLTILHELGHALGLKHPFEGPVTLDAAHDNYFYTIMSYDVKENTSVSSVSADFYPTTPQYLDLLAMDTLYGQSPTANPGNTKYVFYGTQHYWQTINDVSGNDTIIYKSSTGGRIDLSNASFSQLGVPIHFSDGTQSSDTVALGPNTSIENATGGSGNDVIIGSDGNNVLKGGGGNDSLDGGLGADKLNGGSGHDTFVYGNANESTGTKFDTLTGFNTGNDLFDLWFQVQKIDHALNSGTLSKATFDNNLTHDLGAGKLAAYSAVLFTPSNGNEAGKIFLVVDPTGNAGYHSGSDLVILLSNAVDLTQLSTHDFI